MNIDENITDTLYKALKLTKDMMETNGLHLPHTLEVIDSALSAYDYNKTESLNDELDRLFDNHADCYADTREECDDTIPPTLIEGTVEPAMTRETFVKAVTEFLKSKS